jgi:DNA-directed RNA polymerase sigma subunit (sigma70/sigma32)
VTSSTSLTAAAAVAAPTELLKSNNRAMTYSDLVQEGVVALLQAMSTYDLVQEGVVALLQAMSTYDHSQQKG